jgi:hypothetical protein
MVRNGSSCYIFLNGTQIGATGTNSADVQDTIGVGIGATNLGLTTPNLDGLVDNIHISNNARYTATFNPPTEDITFGAQGNALGFFFD